MSIQITPDAPPLRQDACGAWRVGDSRVLLELVIRAHQDGATPEAIVERYSTLKLADVYAVIAYYLRHADQIDHYLQEREEAARAVQMRIESGQGELSEIRDRLNAQREA